MTWVAPRVWIVAGIWVWALPMVFVWIWTGSQTRLGWRLGTVEALVTWASLLGARGIGVWLYNRLWSHSHPLTWISVDGRIVRVPVGINSRALLTLALPFALAGGILANVWGWTVIIPERWMLFPVMLLIASGVYALGSLTLYNQFVTRLGGAVTLSREHTPQGHQVIWIVGRPLFGAVAMLAFLWILSAIVVIWGVAAILLIMLAHHFPAGVFGVEVGLFSAALTLFFGYWTAVLVGLWYALGARLLRSWQYRRGPVSFGRARDEAMS